MDGRGRIAEDLRRPEATPQGEEKVVDAAFSTARLESIGVENVPESQPVVKDSTFGEAVDERDDGNTSLHPTPRTRLATIRLQRDGDETGSVDSVDDVPEGNGNIINRRRVLSGGELPLGGEENIPSRVTNIYTREEPNVEIDGGSAADQGLSEVDNGLGSNGPEREFEEVSSSTIDDTGKGANGSTAEMGDLQITNDRRASRAEVISMDGVKKMEDSDCKQPIAIDGNQSIEVLDFNGPSRNYNEEPGKGLSAGTISSKTIIGSNFQQPSYENEKVVPQNASVKVESLEGLGGRSLYASGFSIEREDGKKPVVAAPKAQEGETNLVLCDNEVGKQEVKVEEEMTRSGVRPQMGNEFLQESVSGKDAVQPTSSDVEIGKVSKKPATTVDSSLKSPSGLGSSTPLLKSAACSVQEHKVSESVRPSQPQLPEDVAGGDAEEYDETREKLQMIRVKFLRLAHRLGQTPHNVVVAQVLYRLGLAEQLRSSMNTTSRAGAFSFDRASAMAEQLEASGQEPLDFSCTIMVIGKTGVGKSATINSIFDKSTFKTDPFRRGTTKVQDITGIVQGIKLRVIDTPGLSPSSTNQPKNERILHAVKRFIVKTPPDVIMYLDRLDMQNRDHGDVPLLRTITNVFGASIWFNAIVVLTHAASAPPDGPNGTPLSYEMYVTQRSHVIQQAVRQAAGDPRLLNPVSLVENHSACRMNRAGQRVLPNGQVWKPHLLLLSFASKILTEANTHLKLQESPVGRPFGLRSRAPPLPFFLSSLLQSRTQPKLPEEISEDSLDVEADEEHESADEYDYDDLPPFKVLTKEQLNNLSKFQRKAYYEELDYREKLFYQKQMKEEKRRRNLLKKMETGAKDLPDDQNNNIKDESGGPASVPVPMPDLALPSSFDSDYPSHRYRFLDSSNQWLVRPVLETQGWDHDVGYEGLNIEKLLVIKEKIPVSLSGQLTKDKKDFTLQMDIASSLKHGEGKATSFSMDMQTVGKDLAYTFHGETLFNNIRRNKTSAGVSATILGDTAATGIKVEDKLIVNKRLKLLMAGGAMANRGEVAYGGRVEATLQDQDYPLGRALSTLALSFVNWHGDLAAGCNLQSQIPVGRHTNVTGYANLSNRGTGQVGIRINSSEQLQLALAALIPIFRNAVNFLFGSSESI